VQSDAGKGATFNFTITARASAAAAPPNWQTAQPQLANKRLLVVEDNATNQLIIKRRATNWGVDVESATNSRDAMRLLAQHQPFDAVILDLQMPDADGFAVAEEIRRQPFGRFLPLLLLSSVRLRNDDSRPAHAGISVFCPQAHPPFPTVGIIVSRDGHPTSAREKGPDFTGVELQPGGGHSFARVGR